MNDVRNQTRRNGGGAGGKGAKASQPGDQDRKIEIGDPVDALPGVGRARRHKLEAIGVATVRDVLLHLPIRYQDHRFVTEIKDIPPEGGSFLFRGRVEKMRGRNARRRGMYIVDGRLVDDTGDVAIVWFNQRWIGDRLDHDSPVTVYGTVSARSDGVLQIVNPEIVDVRSQEETAGRLVPVYRPLGPLTGRTLRRVMRSALPALHGLVDPLPDTVRRSFGFIELSRALSALHSPGVGLRPSEISELENGCSPAHLRLVFDELLAYSAGMVLRRQKLRRSRGIQCRIDDALRLRALEVLPFSLTSAQRRVVREIAEDLGAGMPMARLIQGDVGSGKTVVAALAMLIAMDNGVQAALMAPTELLAVQHHATLKDLFAKTPWAPALLTGAVPSAERKRVMTALSDGSCPLVVGTHALIQESVEYCKLGLVVIDEQHRFGTAQRQKLVQKGRIPHVLVMTATPIPRSLALTLYGDLDVSVIDELPPGRFPVRTEIRTASSRSKVFEFVRREVAEGGRAFVVFPLIEENEAFEARALEAHVEDLRLALKGVEVEVLHGKMDCARQEEAYARFRSGKAQVLAATTVVEVGIDVPEASVMIVESAERFGLAQLHQLRGRVGRGERPSWCILMVSDEAAAASRRRLGIFAETADGFAIAEADLALRGPGELGGSRQWGHLRFRFADPAAHQGMLMKAREAARRLERMGCLEDVARSVSRYHRFETEISVS